MKSIRVGLIQPQVTKNNDENFQHVENLIEQAAMDDPQILCLPERWYFVDPFEKTFYDCIQDQFGTQYQYVRQWAKEYNIGIVSGGIWEWHSISNSEKPYISTYYLDSKGQDHGRQDKIHLYGLEKQGFSQGKGLTIFADNSIGIKFVALICFDLNISSALAKKAVHNGAEFIFSPTLIRDAGFENWKIYVQARALETRTPLLSCNSIFTFLDRKFTGKSKIIHFRSGSASPLQLITHELSNTSGYLIKDIDIDFPNSVRFARLNENVDIKEIKVNNLTVK